MDKRNDKLTIKSGIFAYNKSEFSGGGLDLSLHNQPLVVLKNVIISQNKAAAGAGVWACPTSRVRTHSTLGATIIGNVLNQGTENAVYGISGSDVQFEGYDTKYRSTLTNNNPEYHKMTVQDRTFLGNKVNWYADDLENLYKKGDSILEPDKYTNRSSSFGLYGEILAGKDWYEQHSKSAKLIFIGNEAKYRGGAIATNTDIDFGEENDVNVNVAKAWKDEDGQKLTKDVPKEVSVKLIREDSDGGKYDLETIKLNDENNWTHVFENLPSKGILEGKEVDFSYTVEEVNVPEGYEANLKTMEATEEAQYEFLLENQKKPPEPPKPPEPKTPSEPKTPETGDNDSANILYFAAIIFSLLIVNRILNKNKNKSN